MPTSPPLLQFVRLPGYQSQAIPGSSLLYTVDPNRPIGYLPPKGGTSPTVPGIGLWRASRRDSSVPVASLVAVDMGAYNQLGDAQQACQDDADAQGLNWVLVFLIKASYQSRAVAGFTYLYDIAQASPDATGQLWWRSSKRDASFTSQFQISTPLGNFSNLADAMTSCQNDFAVTFPAYPVF